MSNPVSHCLAGAKAASPLLVGVIPFGLICGAICVSVGMPEWGASAMSVIVFAGASQLVAVQLMAEHASLAVVILTALVINARHFMYSASIAPHFEGISPLRKVFYSYLLTDQAYAISFARFNEADGGVVNKGSYYVGAALTMWGGFNLSTLIGAYTGAVIPPEWDLDFAIPLTFAALVIPAVKDRPALLAAVVAGVISVAASPLPFNLGLMTAAVAGIATGYISERRLSNG
ncbi:AzlC family ABC transporter permease [Pseudodesulfovibrio sp. zrk46]|uniref:AzlC family ABC transporter permease n=1 Tax=Pseudodesulfovibrio sp. zrk46 TaxID=2725288 RepID=UPI00144A25C3|nr:AzlC family ABC transporter permease [Pseudodesulfovibrio sp. zrk46]QJB56470.1 AzlC family ABC transporter permease [Pseudodesulfovibrio sp. zrk46]